MKNKSVFALLFALKLLEASVIVSITAIRHPKVSMHISNEDFRHLFVLKSRFDSGKRMGQACPQSAIE